MKRDGRISTGIILAGSLAALWLAIGERQAAAWQAPAAKQQAAVPAELTQIAMPSGKQFTISLKGMSIKPDGSVQVTFTCSKPAKGAKMTRPDGLAVLCFTRAADAPPINPAEPPRIVALWKEHISMGDMMLKAMRGMATMDLAPIEDRSGRVVYLKASMNSKGNEGVAAGALEMPQSKMLPKVLGAVATSSSVPCSNFIWMPMD
jgi:hypothetical protein